MYIYKRYLRIQTSLLLLSWIYNMTWTMVIVSSHVDVYIHVHLRENQRLISYLHIYLKGNKSTIKSLGISALTKTCFTLYDCCVAHIYTHIYLCKDFTESSSRVMLNTLERALKLNIHWELLQYICKYICFILSASLDQCIKKWLYSWIYNRVHLN